MATVTLSITGHEQDYRKLKSLLALRGMMVSHWFVAKMEKELQKKKFDSDKPTNSSFLVSVARERT